MIASKLKSMNPYASVKAVSLSTSLSDYLSSSSAYSALVYGFRSFRECVELNNTCRTLNIPFYMLNSSGLFGFLFIDVGRELTFTVHKKATDSEEQHVIRESKTFEEYML